MSHCLSLWIVQLTRSLRASGLQKLQVIGHHLEDIVVQREEVKAGREPRDLRRNKSPLAHTWALFGNLQPVQLV